MDSNVLGVVREEPLIPRWKLLTASPSFLQLFSSLRISRPNQITLGLSFFKPAMQDVARLRRREDGLVRSRLKSGGTTLLPFLSYKFRLHRLVGDFGEGGELKEEGGVLTYVVSLLPRGPFPSERRT